MPNPFAGTRFYARLGNLFTRPLWTFLPAPRGFGILTTIGRRSGKPRPQSVRAIRDGDQVFIVCMMGTRTNWLRNVRACPQVTIRLRNQVLRGTAHEIVNIADRRRAADAYIPATSWSDYLDYVVYEWGIPTRRRIERAHRRWLEGGVLMAIELEHASGHQSNT
jgi:deazaflavin-dependent oxidoreductase (nitroreductase family)